MSSSNIWAATSSRAAHAPPMASGPTAHRPAPNPVFRRQPRNRAWNSRESRGGPAGPPFFVPRVRAKVARMSELFDDDEPGMGGNAPTVTISELSGAIDFFLKQSALPEYSDRFKSRITFKAISDIYLTNSLTQGQEEVSGFGTIGLLNFSSISARQDTIYINEFSFFNSDGIEIFVDDLDSGFLPFIIQ